MNRRAVLSVSLVSLAGCTVTIGDSSDDSVEDGESAESDTGSDVSNDQEQQEVEGESTEDAQEPEDLDRPAVESMSVRYDEAWLHLSRTYKTPNYGDEFRITERWTIESEDISLEEEREKNIEPETESDVVLIGQSILFLDRWDNNIQTGEYDVTLVLEAPNGDQSEPVSESVSITEQASQ